MKMKNTISMMATIAAMASAQAAKGDNGLVQTVFGAPIDQILSASDERIVTYRSEAYNVVEQGGKTTTNYYPIVSVSTNYTHGFAFKGPKSAASTLLVNGETGKFVVGSTGSSNEFGIGKLNEDGDALKAVTMEPYELRKITSKPHKMTDMVGYMYDEDHVILFGTANSKKQVVRAVKESSTNGVFTVQQFSDEEVSHTPKMAAHTSSEVFTSDGKEVLAYKRKISNSDTPTPVASNTAVKGMEVVDDTMYYATTNAVINRDGKTVMTMNGITGMAKMGSTLYVATTETSGPSATDKVVPVYGAKQIIAGKQNGKDVLWKLTLANELQNVNE